MSAQDIGRLDWVVPEDVDKVLRLYGKLHDGLSEMIEEGRLTEEEIPDDYQWLVKSLTKLAGYWRRP